jgi:hypothetical protein
MPTIERGVNYGVAPHPTPPPAGAGPCTSTPDTHSISVSVSVPNAKYAIRLNNLPNE